MRVPSLAAAAALSLAALASRPLAAQDQLKTLPPVEVLQVGNTADESALVRDVVARLRARFADASFVKLVDDAIAKRDAATEAKLVAEVARVSPTNLVIMLKARTGLVPSAGMFRLASWDGTDAARNPWFLIFTVGGRVYCASTSAATCHDALHKMGYANTQQVW